MSLINLLLQIATFFAICYAVWLLMEKQIDKNSIFYRYYHVGIKRPLCRTNLTFKKMNRNYNKSVYEMTTNELIIYHGKDFYDMKRFDSYYAMETLSIERKIKFCKKEISNLKNEVVNYLQYTNGKVKPIDVYKLELFKKEIRELNERITGNKRIK
jgi:hypothetical protein